MIFIVKITMQVLECSLRRSDANWVTKATIVNTGLVLAGALLPPRAVDLILRVLNPTEKA